MTLRPPRYLELLVLRILGSHLDERRTDFVIWKPSWLMFIGKVFDGRRYSKRNQDQCRIMSSRLELLLHVSAVRILCMPAGCYVPPEIY
jgi:hypothetical protein